MKMIGGDQARFPKFASYVRTKFPELIRVPSIVHNLKTQGSFTDAEVAEALKWDSGPGIKITDLSHNQCGVPAAFGCTRGAVEVEIDLDTVQTFETGTFAQQTGKNARGQTVFIVGVTLLHELCHLGKNKHGLVEATEAGFGFETGAYGKSVP